jgi:hypothetical protein
MPHKFNSSRRHKFDKKRYKVTNWREYNESLRQRGDVTIWLSPEVEDEWLADKRQTPGGQPVYSDLAISVCLTLGMVYKQPLRQTEGLVGGLLRIMGLDLPVPRASTFSRRGSGLTPSMKSEVQRPGPIDLVVDSTGLKIFGEGALSAACCACACRVRNGCTTSIKPRPTASLGASYTLDWTLQPEILFALI